MGKFALDLYQKLLEGLLDDVPQDVWDEAQVSRREVDYQFELITDYIEIPIGVRDERGEDALHVGPVMGLWMADGSGGDSGSGAIS